MVRRTRPNQGGCVTASCVQKTQGGTTFTLGVSLLAHLCFVVTWLAAGGRPGEGDTLVLLAAWALAMGIQSVAVRQLDVSGVFTTAATATFIFLVGVVANGPVTGEELRR